MNAALPLPLIVVAGPTASGKTRLAIDLALQWGGEIICADSRTVYRGMDIGTAKPTLAEQHMVRHWALDCAYPGERFTVADFQGIARTAIADIRSRGKIPFLVGGTGLYIDAVVLNFVFGPNVNIAERARLEKLTTDQLRMLHKKLHIPFPENDKNRRYLIRSIEKYNSHTSGELRPDAATHVFAIETDRALLRKRIEQRVEMMFAQNIVFETQQLTTLYGHESEALTGNIYPIVQRLMSGEITEATAKRECVTQDWRLAKRQLTWLRRHDFVCWLTPDEISDAVAALMKNTVTAEQYSGTIE